MLKNAIGAALLFCGIAMLVLPGQGLLAIVAGLMLMDFPGRRRMLRRLIGRPAILRGINWIRRKASKPPLVPPRAE